MVYAHFKDFFKSLALLLIVKQLLEKKIKDAGKNPQNIFDKFHYVSLFPIQYMQALWQPKNENQINL